MKCSSYKILYTYTYVIIIIIIMYFKEAYTNIRKRCASDPKFHQMLALIIAFICFKYKISFHVV